MFRFGDQIDVLCEHFRRITFFGISYGSGFVLEIENALDAVLASYGHSLEIRTRLMNSLSAIAVSNMSNAVNAKGPRFRALFLEGTNDRLAEWMNPHKSPVPASGSEVLRMSDNRVLVLAPVLTHVKRWLEFVPFLDYSRLEMEHMGHYIPFFTMRAIPGSQLPGLLEYFVRTECARHLFDKNADLYSEASQFFEIHKSDADSLHERLSVENVLKPSDNL
jgi:hypothetical protein